jgi:DNA (cytosine-5)-methyltransferase 1
MQKSIPVVDLFAGPGGLSEGFSSLEVSRGLGSRYPFHIALSVEKEPFAHKTLRLRAYFRLLLQSGKSLDQYYGYVAGKFRVPYAADTKGLWEKADLEALNLEIGSEASGRILHDRVRQIAKSHTHWVLIGGPPCQAYSLVGRARNKGIEGYKAEEDERHFLYTHYLDLIRNFRPSVFVMENVKGILSSKVGGARIFTRILEDLRAAEAKNGKAYRIYSLSRTDCVYTGRAGPEVDPHDFIVRSELYGVPQARHRVILVGVREDIAPESFRALTKKQALSVFEAIGDLPKLRSGLSVGDSLEAWRDAVVDQAKHVRSSLSEMASAEDRKRIGAVLAPIAKGKLPHMTRGGLRCALAMGRPSTYARKVRDGRLEVVLNHEARGHMEKDLARYLYAITFAGVKKISPSQEYFPKTLAPKHRSWFSGKFADRFRVQLRDDPSTTVTCHIAKDGHYYIHYDLKQCRSLTVREAARLQSFPDNYFFEGNRTQQYVQVGNAVPPLLARQIAKRVSEIIEQ